MSNQTKRDLLTRRQALKNLASLGGALTLLALPSRWEKPQVTGAALPAHQQVSDRFRPRPDD